MSTDLLLDQTPVTYRELVTDLPEGIRVRWSFDPTVSGYDDASTTVNDDGTPYRRRCYVEPIIHVLLADGCGNTLWLIEADKHRVKYKEADFIGEAAFEHFGMQGSLVHFGHAFRAADWGDLYDVVTTLPWDEAYLKRTGDDQTGNRCRVCAGR